MFWLLFPSLRRSFRVPGEIGLHEDMRSYNALKKEWFLEVISLWAVLFPMCWSSLARAEDSPPSAQPSAVAGTQETRAPASVTAKQRKERAANYDNYLPEWALQIDASLNGLGPNPISPPTVTSLSSAASIGAEYQPRFLQDIGVVSLGLNTNFYGAQSQFLAFSVGGLVRYQAKFFRQQFLVPMAAYAFEYFNYYLNNGATGRTLSQGPQFGLWLLLNALDQEAARDFFIDNHVARTYLVLEAHNMNASDINIDFGGFSFYFGLRFEF